MAKFTGYALLLMALVAGFSFGFAFPKIYIPGQPELTHNNLKENLTLYQFMLWGILAIILLDLLISWTIYLYFKNVNKNFAVLALGLRLVYTFIFGIATYYLGRNLGLTDDNNTTIMANYDLFHTVWSIGLIVFGFHLLLVGVLMKQHKLIPRVLWYLTVLAGASYCLVHVLKLAGPELAAWSNTLNNILALPMALGELGLAVWLIWRGGKT